MAFPSVRRSALQRKLVASLAAEDFVSLASVSRQLDNDWDRAGLNLTDALLQLTESRVLTSSPWRTANFQPALLLDIIERGHRLFIGSRAWFGAISFALEEVWLRHAAEPDVRARVHALFGTVRSAFIAYHQEKDAKFEEPPGGAQDSLNVWVELRGGEFMMGTAEDLEADQGKPRRVRVSAFSMQQHQVTTQEYRRFDTGDAFPLRPQYPVANVSWYEAAAYAAWLGASLPTEAQWEYAARGSGDDSRLYPWGDAEPTPDHAVFDIDWIEPVSSRPAGRTPEGLDDMAGNVWEWCRDWYATYPQTASVDPIGPSSNAIAVAADRVVRGGSFCHGGGTLRAAFRGWREPGYRGEEVGFRVVSSVFALDRQVSR